MTCIELEIIGIASLDLFLQLNYTGPSMDRGLKPEEEEEASHPLDGINPHAMFQALSNNVNEKSQHSIEPLISALAPLSSVSEEHGAPNFEKEKGIHSLKETNTTDAFHNAVLSELAIDGEWPFQVCVAPYFLLLARALLSILAEPTRPFRLWSDKENSLNNNNVTSVASQTSLGINSVGGANFAR